MKLWRWLACLLPPAGLIVVFGWSQLSRGDALGVGMMIGLSPVILAIGAAMTAAAVLVVRGAFWLARWEHRLGFAVAVAVIEVGPAVALLRPWDTGEGVQFGLVAAVVFLAGWIIGPMRRAPPLPS